MTKLPRNFPWIGSGPRPIRGPVEWNEKTVADTDRENDTKPCPTKKTPEL